MTFHRHPLVTVVTPVFNGAPFLRDCIESVLAQDFADWEYVIIDNCSTDETRAIAESYAGKDPRVHVTTNAHFLSMPQNFNHAFEIAVKAQSRYCKAVCADDWLKPSCIRKMVDFAESNPTVGIVACHEQFGDQVRWAVLPPTTTVLKGRDACRMVLLNDLWLLPGPTAALYRRDVLGSGRAFFPNDKPHADTSACLEHLAHADFGIVHEVLAVGRVHEQQITSQIAAFGAGDVACLECLVQYGPRYLTAAEYSARVRKVTDGYYRGLGRAALRLKGAAFWKFQRQQLTEIGLRLDGSRVVRGALEVAWAKFRRSLVPQPSGDARRS